MTKALTLGLIAGYFLLWARFSDWSPHLMIFWEGNADPRPPLARVGVAFLLIVVAFVTVLHSDEKR